MIQLHPTETEGQTSILHGWMIQLHGIQMVIIQMILFMEVVEILAIQRTEETQIRMIPSMVVEDQTLPIRQDGTLLIV